MHMLSCPDTTEDGWAAADRRPCCGRGVNGLHIVLLLFAYKLLYPDQCAPSPCASLQIPTPVPAGQSLINCGDYGNNCQSDHILTPDLRNVLQRVSAAWQPRVGASDPAVRLLHGVHAEGRRGHVAARLQRALRLAQRCVT